MKKNKIKNALNKIQGKSFQPGLLDVKADKKEWEKHWKDLPEFVNEDASASTFKITVHIKSEEDLKKFSELMQQTVTTKTKFIQFPKRQYENLTKRICIDKEKEK